MSKFQSKSHRLLVASAIVGSLAWHSAVAAQASSPADAAGAVDATAQPSAAAPSGTPALVDNQAVTANDIIVTATRTTARLENVPATIVAVSGKALETAGVTKFQDLALIAPGVQVSRSGTYTQPAIRGISTSFAGGGQETNVAVYIDGIYQSDQLGTNQDLSNIQGIEILKGPQGTLYGRNATGGAILITTRSPTDKFQAEANASYAWRYNDKIGNLFIGGPIANGIKASIAASYHDSDGYFKDINGFAKNVQLDDHTYTFGGHGSLNFAKLADRRGNNTAPYKNWSVRPKLVIEPLDGLKITLGYVHTYLNDPRGLAYLQVQNQPAANLAAGYNELGVACSPPASNCNARATKRFTTSVNLRPYNQSKQDEINGTIEWKLGDLGTITSHTAWRRQHDYQIYELDGVTRDPALATSSGGTDTYDATGYNKRRTFTQQLDYSGQFGNLQLLSGFFYYNDRFQSDTTADVGTATNPTLSRLDFRTKAYGIYIDGTYNFSNKLFLTAGVRYNHDEKRASNIRWDNAGVISPANTSYCVTGGPNSVLLPGCTPDTPQAPNYKKVKGSAWTPHAVVRYNLSRGTNIYASISRGFKAPTINGGAPFNALKPETVTAYEVGLKTARGGFRGEASVFYYDYKNNQISAFNGTTTVTSNSGGAHVYGLDLSLNYKVPDMPLNLRGSMEFLHARYTDYHNAGNVTTSSGADFAGVLDNPATPLVNESQAPTVNTTGNDGTGTNTTVIGDWTGRRLLRAPDWTASVGADYTLEGIFGGKMVISATAQYSSRYAPQNASYYCSFYQAVDPTNLTYDGKPQSGSNIGHPMPVNQRPTDVAGQKYCDPGQNKAKGRFEENGWAQLNAQINWTDASERFTIGVFGNNINNVQYKIVSSQAGYGKYELYNEPRTFGVRAAVKY